MLPDCTEGFGDNGCYSPDPGQLTALAISCPGLDVHEDIGNPG
jgi:hypothetical protein